MIDLVHPKKHYKHQLSTSLPHDEDTRQTQKDGKVHRGLNDSLDFLKAWDEVWFKNHNPHHHARWIKATFIKKHSPNVFQVQIGSALTMAHRMQLRKAPVDPFPERHPVVLLRRFDEREVDARHNEVQGQTENVRENLVRKRKIPELAKENTEVRKSKWRRKMKRDDIYEYN